MSATILVGSSLGLLVAALYGYVGLHQARRARSVGLAAGSFATFWIALAIHAAIESAWALWVAFGPAPSSLALGITVLMLKIGTGVGGIGALVGYLILVYREDRRVVLPIAVTYMALHALMMYDYLSRVPTGVETRTWYAGLQYAHPAGTLHLVVAVLLFLPPLVATACYLLLLRFARTREQRRRILATGAGFIVFFGGFLLGWVNEHWAWWGLMERLLALAAAAGILWTLPTHEAERRAAPQAS